ncbi:hypothetical protein ACIF9R_24155 [Streptomyces sp. NPDC086080]|uniref:DUF7848 domain-containing protein n=1 Tax=Streptomyces sp. NPDC086080 TaxID=3365748 RepID=UPI0037D81B23
MTRSVISAAGWALEPETGEDAQHAVYSAVCMVCGAEAPASANSPEPAEIWALKHTGLNPAHRQYKAMVESYWCVTPAADNPYRALDAQGA